MTERMGATLGTLTVLRVLSEGPASRERLLEAIEDELGARKRTRALQRYLKALRDVGFDVRQRDGKYELLRSPTRLMFTDREALATLSVVESLAEREPVYGEHLASSARKLREALPKEAVEFADHGRVEFDLDFVSDPPEDPEVLEVLRRATYHHQKVEIHYYSISSGGWSHRKVEPLSVSYAQRAHRLYAYDPSRAEVTEFRVNRIDQARMLPEKFSPEAHTRRLDVFKVRLTKNAFIAYKKNLFHASSVTIEPLRDGGALVEGRTSSTFWTVRELAALGPDAEVLGGSKLKEEFLKFLHDTRSKYS